MYIGSSCDIRQRWSAHRSLLDKDRHHSKALQRAWLKYSKELTFNILLICEEKDLLLYEQQYLNFYKPRYNSSVVAGSPMKGMKHSEETRKQMSLSHTGKTHTEEAKLKVSKSKIGKPRPQHVIDILKKHNKTRRGANHPCFGKPRSQETKDKISQTRLKKAERKIKSEIVR